MIKHILVPTDGSEQAMRGVRYAVAVAKQYGATLHGLHVLDIKLIKGPILHDVSASIGTAPYLNYEGQFTVLLEERGRTALDSFRSTCEAADVQYTTDLVTGMIVRTILEKMELCDLVVLGRSGEHSEWLEGLLGSTTQSVVRRSTRPVLITGRETPGSGRYLIAYDGSSHAKGALKVAAMVATDWQVPLEVLVVGDDKTAEITDEARSYLDAHSLEATYSQRQGDAGEAIVTHAAEHAVDLLIMGAYGHTKVRELVVGSTTAYVLNHAPCPLLLTR